MDIRLAARILGGEAVGARQVVCPGPAHSPRDRSLSVTLSPDGSLIVHSFAGDDWRDCKEYVRDLLGLGRDRLRAAPRLPAPVARDTTRFALAIWGECTRPTGTVVERYLGGRGLAPDAADIRFHQGLHYEGDRAPAMVCLMRDVRTGAPCGIHRTFLTRDGQKLERRMLGRARGAAIQLDPVESATYGLGIAEGVETALSARSRFRPMWATGSAGSIRHFAVLPSIEALTVFADGDDAGLAAARECAARWSAAGAEVAVVWPKAGGDMNDLLRGAP